MVKHDPALLSIFQAPLSFGMALYVIFLVTFFTQPGNSGLCWTVFARTRDTAVPAEGNGDLQTLILCLCGETQTMSHIVESCPLTKLNGSLSRLHSADKDAVLWLTTDQLWLMTRIREEEVSTGTPTYFTGMPAYHCRRGRQTIKLWCHLQWPWGWLATQAHDFQLSMSPICSSHAKTS